METQKLDFFFKRGRNLNFDLYFDLFLKSRNHLKFDNISPILVIDASMESSSQALQHGNPKF